MLAMHNGQRVTLWGALRLTSDGEEYLDSTTVAQCLDDCVDRAGKLEKTVAAMFPISRYVQLDARIEAI